LRAGPKTAVNGHRLPKGTTVSELPCDAFEAAALALEMTADDLEGVGAGADPVGDVQNEPTHRPIPTQPAVVMETAGSPAKPSAIHPDGGVKSASTASAGPVLLDRANIAAMEYLATASEPTSRGCVGHIKKSCNGSFSLGRLRKLGAWNAHMAKRRADDKS